MMRLVSIFTLAALCLASSTAFAQAERVWLAHASRDAQKVVVCWTTAAPSASIVRIGTTKDYGEEVQVVGDRKTHQVEIPLSKHGRAYHYSVGPASTPSPDAIIKSRDADEMRVAVVANWHAKADLSALLADDVHLLVTAGDNVSSLHQKCGVGVKDCTAPYAELIDAYPQLFRSTPFMPVLGNHDREIRLRGPKPPAEPVYDVDATAFRKFFALPGDEWKWHIDVPEFGVRFIALDLNHISDQGTTWQTCHALDADSEQFKWYETLMTQRPPGFCITLYNERNATMRGQAKGKWNEQLQKNSACISGFGHFAERAEVDGVLYFNTSLGGKGARYPDPKSKAIFSEDNYVLLRFQRDPQAMTVELKNLAGDVLDRTEVPGKW